MSGFAPPGDIHRVRNTGDGVAISMHVYGADISRLGNSIRREYTLPSSLTPPPGRALSTEPQLVAHGPARPAAAPRGRRTVRGLVHRSRTGAGGNAPPAVAARSAWLTEARTTARSAKDLEPGPCQAIDPIYR